MDQGLFNIVVGVAGFFGALWVWSVKADHKELKDDFKKHRDEMLNSIVRKSEFDRAVDELKGMLREFFDRLDRKVDK